jgi:NTE family protein
MAKKSLPKVRLVLASGGARGMAHIGVIERLEEQGYEIIEIVGCSMGAVVGGLYASGTLTAYTNWLLSLKRSDIFKLMDFTFTRYGFVKGEKVFSTILPMVGNKNIEDLAIKFTAIATDMEKGEEVLFTTGDLFTALRASVSIPGIFTPVNYNNLKLIDGGVINPLPLNLVKKQANEIVVAVNINAPISLEKESEEEPNPAEESKSWLSLNWPFQKKTDKKETIDPNLVNILQTSYDHMQNRLINLMLQNHPPDLLVNVPRDTCGMFDFYKAKEVIALGRNRYDDAIKQADWPVLA